MKQYNNGPRKGMMYGGMSKRKPMMYGGMATKKPRKKAYGGGMMSATQPQQNQMANMTSGQANNMQTAMMQMPKMRMSKGGKTKSSFPDLNKDGKITQADILKGRGVI